MRQQLTKLSLAATATVITLSAGCSIDDTPNEIVSKPALAEPALALPELKAASEQATADQYQKQAPRSRLATKGIHESESSVMPKRELNIQAPQQRSLFAAQSQAYEDTSGYELPSPARKNTENYQPLENNAVIRVADQSTSTFSIDVDTGAYSNMRRFLKAGQLPPADAIRVEELLNYFNYDYEGPKNIAHENGAPDKAAQPFSIHTEMSRNPWNENTRLLHIGLKGYTVDTDSRPEANLVFLIDVSGSMADPNKLGLLKSSINMLTKELDKKDSVSIVVYAGASGVVLEPTAGNKTRTIARALEQLRAGGSTNGEAGIELAYAMAEKKMSASSINRIILATDGDFNVGISDIEKLKKLIESKRESGIALTTLGFGSGNYNDYLMEQLANVGNGNYAYIDTLNEARKVLSEELNATLMTIAKDVKIQIEFNPAQVSEYRLLGYVNRALANEDFSNDKVDAGEIGAGHTVTALYEVSMVGDGGERHTQSRYQKTHSSTKVPSTQLKDEIAEIRLRYKKPHENNSQLLTRVVLRAGMTNELNEASDNFRFSAAVAGFAQLLRQSKYLSEFGYDEAAELALTAKSDDRFGYRTEFIQLVDLANELDQLRQARLRGANDSTKDEKEG